MMTNNRSTESLYLKQDVGSDVVKEPQNVVKDVVKETEMQLSERQLHIIAYMSLYPAVTASELAVKMSVDSTVTARTVQRDIAFLQNHNIIKREGGRKEGKWIVLQK